MPEAFGRLQQREGLARVEAHRPFEPLGVDDPHVLVIDGDLDHRVRGERRDTHVLHDIGQVGNEVGPRVGKACRDLVDRHCAAARDIRNHGEQTRESIGSSEACGHTQPFTIADNHSVMAARMVGGSSTSA